MTKSARTIWFALADGGTGAVAPVNWKGQLTIGVFWVTLFGSMVVPMVVGEAIGVPGLAALGLAMPFLVFVPFILFIRLRLDNTRTRSEYLKSPTVSEGSVR